MPSNSARTALLNSMFRSWIVDCGLWIRSATLLSPIQFPRDDVQARQDRHHVAEEFPLAHAREGLVVEETRRAHPHPPRLLRAVAHEVPPELPVRRLRRGVDLPLGGADAV